MYQMKKGGSSKPKKMAIGSSKKMKKYEAGGVTDGKPVIKGVASAIKIAAQNQRKEDIGKKYLENAKRTAMSEAAQEKAQGKITPPPYKKGKQSRVDKKFGETTFPAPKLKKGGSVKSKKK